jgi:CheY-like chemotaxis protein
MGHFRILVIDDDSFEHKLLDKYLGEPGYEVLHAESGVQGLRMMEGEKPDLVLLDVRMPVMSGFGALKEIKQKQKLRDIPVLLVTGLDRDHLREKGLEMGASDYITKPFRKKELLARIQEALIGKKRHGKIERDLEGDLSNVGLSELLQTMNLGKKTGIVRLEEIDGEIYVKKGLPVHSRLWSFTDSKALQRIFFLEKGRFSVAFTSIPDDIPQKPASVEGILLAISSYVDELKTMMAPLPGRDSMVEIVAGGQDFSGIGKFRPFSPLPLADLLVMMEGNLKENADAMTKAFEAGKLRVLN